MIRQESFFRGAPWFDKQSPDALPMRRSVTDVAPRLFQRFSALPDATLRRIDLSGSASATSFFNRAFSFSSVFKQIVTVQFVAWLLTVCASSMQTPRSWRVLIRYRSRTTPKNQDFRPGSHGGWFMIRSTLQFGSAAASLATSSTDACVPPIPM